MPQAEDVKRVVPSSGEPYIDAKAQIKNVLPPTRARDAGTKEYVDNVGSAAASDAIDTITNQFDALLDASDALRIVNGDVDAQGAKIKNIATLQTEQDAAINGTTLSNRFPTLLDNNDALRIISSEVDAQSARIKNVGDAILTNQNDAINVNTLTEQFPNLLDDNDALRVISNEIDAQSKRIKNLANATLSNQNDAVNVASVKLVMADGAPTVDLITLSLLTDSDFALSSVNAKMVEIGTYINRLEQALKNQSVIK